MEEHKGSEVCGSVESITSGMVNGGTDALVGIMEQ